jgi:hypothetical protein
MIIGEQNGEQAASYPFGMGSSASGARRRGRNEGSIYKDEAKGRWYGAVSLGYGPDGQTWRRHMLVCGGLVRLGHPPRRQHLRSRTSQPSRDEQHRHDATSLDGIARDLTTWLAARDYPDSPQKILRGQWFRGLSRVLVRAWSVWPLAVLVW